MVIELLITNELQEFITLTEDSVLNDTIQESQEPLLTVIDELRVITNNLVLQGLVRKGWHYTPRVSLLQLGHQGVKILEASPHFELLLKLLRVGNIGLCETA